MRLRRRLYTFEVKGLHTVSIEFLGAVEGPSEGEPKCRGEFALRAMVLGAMGK